MTRFSKQTLTALVTVGVLVFGARAMPSVAAEAHSEEAASARLAHMGEQHGDRPGGGVGMMGPGMMGGGMMGSGMMGSGQGMRPGMMESGPGMGPGMMQRDQSDCPGILRGGSMMMEPGMMSPRTMGRSLRVVPQQHLSVDDVRHFLGHWLERNENKRLKVGEVKEADEDSITADVVTADNSLVWRFKIDRHTARMTAVE